VIGEVEFAMKIRMHHSREAGEENRKYMMLGCRKWAKNANMDHCVYFHQLRGSSVRTLGQEALLD